MHYKIVSWNVAGLRAVLKKEQQNEYLNKLAKDNADLINFAQKKVAKSKTAEHDMAVDLHLAQI